MLNYIHGFQNKNDKECGRIATYGIVLHRKKQIYRIHVECRLHYAGVDNMDQRPLIQSLELKKFYAEADSEGLSLGTKEGSSLRSPTPFGGPMLQRAVLCN